MAFKTTRAVLLPALLSAFAGVSAPPAAAEQLLTHPFSTLPVSTSAVASGVMQRGETLEYEIYWGIINVGRSFLRIENVVDIASRPAWHIVSGAKSSSFINNFYKVNDRNESWMDTETYNSYGYYKKLSEGKYFFNEWVIFDLPGAKYYGQKMNRKREVSQFEGVLGHPVNDMLSAIFRLRVMKLETGGSVEIDVNTKKNWRLVIKTGKKEKIETPYGKKKCLQVEPMAGEEGLFVAKAGKRMLVWITDDELKLPMVLKAEIFIGSITAKLVRREIR
ncbi:MAG: hypothetical protein A2234_10800 [Elusimicrobia bacterium RIFOXYA2_FULL_58_8]|nr:MAG: hypothetical protein A2285_05405 [Elusimicrobia bacterium RIFOXYA12_FULL_57_11]OGS14905.1 MAG: hypothetical protein A2234_10800 [Elusimicrobia bacterium RIFOXYA2_FULL_58_8]